MKQNKILIAILMVLILAIGGLIYFNLFGIKPKPEVVSPPSSPVQQQTQVTPYPTLEPTLAQKTQEVLKKGGEIPFDYEVTLVEKDKVWLKGLRGELLVTESPNVTFYFRKEGVDTPAKFSDFKVGQKVVIETTAPPDRKIKVYIVSE